MLDRPPHRWMPGDFVTVLLVGLAGAFVAALAGFAVATTSTLLLFAIVAQHGGHLAALNAVSRRRGGGLAGLGLQVEPSDGVWTLFGAGLQLALAVLFSPLAEWLAPEGTAQALAEQLVEVQGTGIRIGLVLAIALLAPVVEELMFRGMLLQMVEERRGPVIALLASAGVFAAFHLLGVGSTDPWRSSAVLLPQLFVVGLILGRLAQRHGRLGPAIFTHAGFNLIAIIALFVAPELVGS